MSLASVTIPEPDRTVVVKYEGEGKRVASGDLILISMGKEIPPDLEVTVEDLVVKKSC